MGLFKNLFGKPKKASADAYDDRYDSIANDGRRVIEIDDGQPKAPVAQNPARPSASTATPNIWDIPQETTAAGAPVKAPTLPPEAEAAAAAVASDQAMASAPRRRRTKTRLIGFDQGEGQVVDLFGESDNNAKVNTVKFPVGWIAVVEGKGRGEVFALQTGMSQIGRGEDQAVRLDFGDTAISRSNHAAIVYDPEMHKFLLGHGGKSNVVRLNDQPLISNEVIKTGDLIRIGETTLKFVALCDEKFNWDDDKTSKGSDDVEIA